MHTLQLQEKKSSEDDCGIRHCFRAKTLLLSYSIPVVFYNITRIIPVNFKERPTQLADCIFAEGYPTPSKCPEL